MGSTSRMRNLLVLSPLSYRGRRQTMKGNGDSAFVVSLHYEVYSPHALRINLKWQGEHDISAFHLERLGQVVHSEMETEHTGWVIIRSSHLVMPGEAIPLRK
jgi:hypothetical protein